MEAITDQPAEQDHQFSEAVIRQAEADATSVAELVRSASVQVQRQNGTYEPLGLPPEMLLGLGLAVQLSTMGTAQHLRPSRSRTSVIQREMDRVTSECCGNTPRFRRLSGPSSVHPSPRPFKLDCTISRWNDLNDTRPPTGIES